MKPESARQGMRLSHPVHLLALGFGTGLAPKAPGTVGTLVGLPFYWLFCDLGLLSYALIVAAMFVAGVYICDATARAAGVHDHPSIVWDEVVGYLITMFAAPAGWYWPLVGFLAFRVFDIVKPWPIRQLDRHVAGGFGIMIDDVVGGLFGLAVMQALAWWL